MTVSRREVLRVGGLAAASLLAPWDIATAHGRGVPAPKLSVAPFSVALISDSHLMPDAINSVFARRQDLALRAILDGPERPDFIIFGGNLWHMGGVRGLELGAARLQALGCPVHMVAGDHDWYPDFGESFRALFGRPYYSFNHKGVHVVVLMNRNLPGADGGASSGAAQGLRALTASQRMQVVAALSGPERLVYEVGEAQLRWLAQDLTGVPVHTPLVVVSHGPLYEHYAPWRFTTQDAKAVHALLKPFANVTLLHGLCKRPLVNTCYGRTSYGMASTAWAWPSAPGRANDAVAPKEPLGFARLWLQQDGQSQVRYFNLTGDAMAIG